MARSPPLRDAPGSHRTHVDAAARARGSMVAGTTMTSRRARSSTRIVAKSSVHCCSLRNAVAPSSFSPTAASAASWSGYTVTAPDAVLVAKPGAWTSTAI